MDSIDDKIFMEAAYNNNVKLVEHLTILYPKRYFASIKDGVLLYWWIEKVF
jgi:hypothetical protein